MRCVTKFLIMLLLVFCLSFCFFGVGVAYADTALLGLNIPSVTFTLSDNSTKVTTNYVSSTTSSSGASDYFASVLSAVGCFSSRISFTAQNIVKYDSFTVPFSFSQTGLNFSDLSVEVPVDFKFISLAGYAVPKIHATYRTFAPDFTFSGTASITFSDGTSKSVPISFNSSQFRSISFSAKKSLFSNEYIMTSEDFTLKSQNKQVALSATKNVKLTANETAQLIASAASIINKGNTVLTSDYAQISGMTQLTSGLGNMFTVRHMLPGDSGYVEIGGLGFSNGSINSAGTGGFALSLGDFAAKGTSFESGLADLAVTSADFTLAAGDFVLTDAKVEPSLVTLDKSSPDIYVTGFSVSGSFTFPARFLDWLGPFDFNPFSNEQYNSQSYFLFGYSAVCNFGEAENMVAHIAGTVDNIYRVLRFDLPLQIKHLLIPTTEEVSDVVEEAVEDIKNNAGGLGEAVTAVDNDFKQFMTALSSGKAGSLKIPACVVNVNGQKYTLWNEFDVSPYFQLAPIKAIVSYVVPILEFFVASYVIYQLYYLWISLLSGNSYFAFLKSLRELNDEEGA